MRNHLNIRDTDEQINEQLTRGCKRKIDLYPHCITDFRKCLQTHQLQKRYTPTDLDEVNKLPGAQTFI